MLSAITAGVAAPGSRAPSTLVPGAGSLARGDSRRLCGITQMPDFQLTTRENTSRWASEWEADEQEVYCRVIDPTDNVLMIGGNIGGGCLRVDKFLASGDSQLCVEPNPSMWRTLEANKAASASSFGILKAAITESPEPILMNIWWDDPQGLGSSTSVGEASAGPIDGDGNRQINISKTTMSLVQKYFEGKNRGGIDTILADCEGCVCGFWKEYKHTVLPSLQAVAFEADGSDFDCYVEMEADLRSNGFEFVGCPTTVFRAWMRNEKIKRTPEVLMRSAMGKCRDQKEVEQTAQQILGSTEVARAEPVDASRLWAGHIHQPETKPRQVEAKVYAHMYWDGKSDDGKKADRAALAIKSVLATQPRNSTQIIVWLQDKEHPPSRMLQMQRTHGIELREFDYDSEVRAPGVDARWQTLKDDIIRKFASNTSDNDLCSPRHGCYPKYSIISDLTRYLVLFNYGGVWFDADTMFLRDIAPLLPYEFAYPWGMWHENAGGPQEHSLNGAVIRLFQRSEAASDILRRVADELVPFGLWGLSALREDTKHANLRILDVRAVDALWKDDAYFKSAVVAAELMKGETYDEALGRHKESTRFGWFFSSDPKQRAAGLGELAGSDHPSVVYHWHNQWQVAAAPGSAFRLYEDLFDCVISNECSMTPK
jgi:hypothetical protein